MIVAGLAILMMCGDSTSFERQRDYDRQRDTAHEFSNLLGHELQECRTDKDCANVVHPRLGPMTKCTATKVCHPPGSYEYFDLPYGSCVSHQDCGAHYMCLRSQCVFIGPRGCHSNADCPLGSPMTFECIERASSAPGKKCYPKCTTNDDCYLCEGKKCHHAYEEVVANYGCCHEEGFCSKKKACKRLKK